MELNELYKKVSDAFGEDDLLESAAMPNTVNAAMPMVRETMEVWDPIQKCKVIRYKDELLKELYKDLSISINPFEYGA